MSQKLFSISSLRAQLSKLANRIFKNASDDPEFLDPYAMLAVLNLANSKLGEFKMKLHPNGDVSYVFTPNRSGDGIDLEDLTYPPKYSYNTKNGITNKHNTSTGLYHCYRLTKV